MSDDHASMPIGKWLTILDEFMPSPKVLGPFHDFNITARQRRELIDALLNIPEGLEAVYIDAYRWLFTRLYEGVEESETWFGRQFRDLREIVPTLNDEQIALLRELPEGHLEHDPSQRFTGQRKKEVRPPGYTTFSEVLRTARDLASGITPEA